MIYSKSFKTKLSQILKIKLKLFKTTENRKSQMKIIQQYNLKSLKLLIEFQVSDFSSLRQILERNIARNPEAEKSVKLPNRKNEKGCRTLKDFCLLE
jgi:hypothetical protein